MSLLKWGGIRPKLSTFVWLRNVIGMNPECGGTCVRQIEWAFSSASVRIHCVRVCLQCRARGEGSPLPKNQERAWYAIDMPAA